jgi:DNA-binding IclR family transcriptional regulator
LERSASGRIFLAFLEDADGEVRRQLGKTVEQVRVDRMAMTDGLLNAGFAAISVPVFDHLGELAGAITTLGAAGHLDLSREGTTAGALRAAGESASTALGYAPGKDSRGSEPGCG